MWAASELIDRAKEAIFILVGFSTEPGADHIITTNAGLVVDT
jgi:hypothetical protein